MKFQITYKLLIMKNSRKITVGLVGLVFMLLTISCEKESIDDISDENLLLDNTVNLQADQNGGSNCNSVIDLALVIDNSGSMAQGTKMIAAKNGAKLLVDKLNSGASSALVSFNSSATRQFDLTLMDEAGQIALQNAIDQLFANGGTNIGAGVIYGTEELTGDESLFPLSTSPSGNNRDDAQKIIILLSDGITSDPAGTEAAAALAKAEGIRIISIAVDGADVTFMEGLASSADDFYTTDDAGLEAAFEEISGTICTGLVVNLDVHPTSCPNPLSLKSRGLLPVSINGSETLDVNEIDVSSITLAGISPVNSSIEDVTTFFEVNLDEPLDPYSCTTLEGDGYDDLTLKFDYQELRAALGAFNRDDVLILEISGSMNDGTDFIGHDIVIAK